MKIQIKKIVGVLLACAGIMTSTSCADFEEINKNPYLPDKDMEQKDGVLNGAYMPNLEKHIIPVPLKTDNTDLTNAYQISINLCGDSWIGYFSPRDNKWNEASNTTTFFFSEGWVNLMYEYAITNIFAPWIQLNTHIKTFGQFCLNEINILCKALHKFSKWIKQSLRTQSFFGTTENIVYTQI